MLFLQVDLNEFKQRQADVSIVSGLASLPDYVFRSRGKMVFIPVASKKYVEENGKINSPQDLQNHITFGNLYPKRYSFTVTLSEEKRNGVKCSARFIYQMVKCRKWQRSQSAREWELLFPYLYFAASMNLKPAA